MITCLILWSFKADNKWGTITVNARTPTEARQKLKDFLKETNFIIKNPSLLESCFNQFTMEENPEVIQSVVL